jgi:hypothetical protein
VGGIWEVDMMEDGWKEMKLLNQKNKMKFTKKYFYVIFIC